MSKVKEWLEQDKLTLLEAWARDGLTEEQIAHNMGICLTSFKNWKNKEVAIMTALKKGKEVVDYEVENALLKRALGYKYKEVTKERVYNSDTKEYEFKITKEVEKEVVPDTTAQIYWLKNRKPKQWKDKIEVASDNVTTLINDNINNIADLINNPQSNRSDDSVQ